MGRGAIRVTSWRIVQGPRTYNPDEGRDCDVGWAYEIEREGELRAISVERASTAGTSGVEDDDAHRAISTRGRSAVQSHLDDDDPPRRLIVSTHGVGPAT
jgi:hypothetical protein